MDLIVITDSIVGGLFIGVAAVTLYVFLGRVAGISGITWQVVALENEISANIWRWCFIGGLIMGPLLLGMLGLGSDYESLNRSPIIVLVSGVLVGVGSKIGSGCTSGHAVCGVARLSKRSIVATACFMSSGILTATTLGLLSDAS